MDEQVEDKKPEEKPKPKWQSVNCHSHNLIETINNIEADGYDVFQILSAPSPDYKFIIIGKIK